MNVSQMHERLRLELLRRIQRGTLSVSLLARQSGLGQSHLSNFLHRKRQLSLAAMDQVLAAIHLTAADLVPSHHSQVWRHGEDSDVVPLVSHSTAMFEPIVRASAVQKVLPAPPGLLARLQSRSSNSRRAWQRFVAVQASLADAVPMDPLIAPDALVFVDRHYNSLVQYRPARPNLYVVRDGGHLKLGYLEFQSNRLLLRPHSRTVPLEVIELLPGESPGDVITGRVILVMNEL